MTEQQVKTEIGTGIAGNEDCLLELVEKVHQYGSGEYINELRGHVVDIDRTRGVATLACFTCPLVLDLTPDQQVTERYDNFEQCVVPEVRARMRLRTSPS